VRERITRKKHVHVTLIVVLRNDDMEIGENGHHMVIVVYHAVEVYKGGHVHVTTQGQVMEVTHAWV